MWWLIMDDATDGGRDMSDVVITGRPHEAALITVMLGVPFIIVALGVSVCVCFFVLGMVCRTHEWATSDKGIKSLLAFLWHGSKG